MNYYEVSMVGSVGAYYDILTYQSTEQLDAGLVIKVPVGKKGRTSLGVIIRQVSKPDFDCKEIDSVCVPTPMPTSLLELHQWLIYYYAISSGVAWQSFLPARVGVKPRQLASEDSILSTPPHRTQKLLNECQQAAVDQIRQSPPGTIMLHGITGSGKTEVYKTIAQDTITNGKSVIILVPEISLTTQLVNDFRSCFTNVVVTHSAMKDAERNRIWRQILSSTEPIVVIGPRSALFMPVQNLGLVVIDECHEPSYKQEASPRYHAITVASKLCQICQAKLILGSATPSISDYYLAQHFKRPIITMNQLAKADAVKPTTKIINLGNRDNFTTESRLFTKPLLEAMHQAIKQHRQVLLFHNRRGTAGLVMCSDCGWIATCPKCMTPLVLHHDKFQLICHLCGHAERPPLACPECHQTNIAYKGIGTKRIEDEATRLFPQAKIRRFDGDTAKGETVQDIYDELRTGQTDIIVGTQTIAKGLDLPHLAVVGVVQADAGLALPDFSANERTFQLIAQACGRIGRHSQPTTAIVQTYRPDDPIVTYGATQDYQGFYSYEIAQRQHGHFPPFSYLLRLTCVYKTETGAVTAATRTARQLRRAYGNQIKLLGPAPAFHERANSTYRWQIIVRASRRPVLTDIASIVAESTGRWQIELDPVSLI